MNFQWSKRMERKLEERMSEVEESMEDLSSGVRKYLKKKSNGGFNYMYTFKKTNGEIDYLLKCGNDRVHAAVAAPNLASNNSTQDQQSEKEGSGDEEGPGDEERRVEKQNLKSGESDDEEEEEEEKEISQDPHQALALVPAIMSSPFAEAPTTGLRRTTLCPHCHCLMKECHATRYGRFLSFVGLTKCNSNFSAEVDEIKTVFKQTYHTVHEWEKVVRYHNGHAQVIKDDIMNDDLPQCVLRFRDQWLARLKTYYNTANETFSKGGDPGNGEIVSYH